MPADIIIPETGWYVLANARLHRSLTPGLAAAFDADGFALADIAVAEGKITGIAARGDKPLPPRAVDLAGRIVLPAFVDCHTHIDKGHIWPRKPNPDGSFMGALECRRRRSRRALERGRCRAAHGVLAALRLRARHQGAADPSRFGAAAGGDLLAGVRGDAASAGRAASNCRRPACSASTAHATSSGWRCWPGASPRRTACSAPSPTWCPTSMQLLDRIFAPCDRTRPRSRFPRRRDRRCRGDLAEEDRRGGTAPQIRGQDPGRPLLLAGAPAGQGRARHAGQGGARRARRRVAADVQSLSAGPPARRHDAALARRDAAARDEGARHSGSGRVRQHARSVLRLWRSRHARSLSHGDAHPAFRSSGRRLAASGRRRRPPTSCGYRAPEHWPRAGLPISWCFADAAGPSCCRGRNRSGSWCATARRSSGSFPTMPNSTS